jgi:RNA polymerase sigma factor (sigma-70 family)
MAGWWRLPSNIQTQIRKLHKTQETLSETLDREPTLEEIAAAMGPGYTTDSIRDLMINSYESYSLDKPSQNIRTTMIPDGTNLFDSIPDDSEETPKEAAEAAERSQRFTEALKTLSGRELEVLLRRYGIGKPKQTLQEIAQIYGVSLERIRQIELAAEKKIKKAMAGYVN